MKTYTLFIPWHLNREVFRQVTAESRDEALSKLYVIEKNIPMGLIDANTCGGVTEEDEEYLDNNVANDIEYEESWADLWNDDKNFPNLNR